MSHSCFGIFGFEKKMFKIMANYLFSWQKLDPRLGLFDITIYIE